MSEEWRQFFYPFGFISSIAFTLRFLVQWIYSESKQKSTPTRSFWVLSLIGNITLMIHSGIQIQYPICLIQAFNGVIAIRNLNLMGEREKVWSLKTTVLLLAAAFVLTTFGFYLSSPLHWIRVPIHRFAFLAPSFTFSLFWHLLGALGVFLFAIRFWIQWIDAERNQKSTLSESFWWLSILGASLSLLYFFFLGDFVNLLGPLFGIFPYIRNLILIKNKTAVYGRP
ncbi:MAG: lipid-A-disaccharide synthase N-terminal domain-containing protein [Parachlamydiaceae bacterium]